MMDAIFSKWETEIMDALKQSNSLCLAIYAVDKQLLFANDAFKSLLLDEPCQSLINPTFDKIISLQSETDLVFSGYLTIGANHAVNTSILASIYRKEDAFLIIGGMDVITLTEQNKVLHEMNNEITKLQRELLHKTALQEKTLEQLKLVNEELRIANQDKDRFLKILAHDLRNPFFSIVGYSDLLLKNFRKYDEEKMAKQLTVINQTTRKTFSLLEELLLWSKSQSGKLPFEPRLVLFNQVCNEVLDVLTENANAKQIQINCSNEESVKLYVDANMFRTVLRNLISNAIKFTPEQGEIRITVQKEDQFARISVADNGVGIDSQDIPKLWAFSETHTTRGTMGEKGTGLGLMLCKEFVEKNGGTIWVDSALGKGSDFKFTVPLYAQ